MPWPSLVVVLVAKLYGLIEKMASCVFITSFAASGMDATMTACYYLWII
jgi:hypothetical protein